MARDSSGWLVVYVGVMAGAEDARTVEDVDFDVFYRRAEPQLRRALVATLGVAVGREAAAAAMAYGFEHWDRVRRYESPVGYLYQVGRSSIRTRREPLRLVDVAPVDDARFDAELWDAVRRLPLTQRTAVVLISGWKYTLQETADVLGVTVSTVRNHHARGLRRLRETIGDSDG